MLAAPKDVGFSAERLAHIERFMRERYVEPGKIAGAITLVSRHGKVALLSAQGLADRERNIAMREDTIFRIYSMTKPITSIAMMMLVEEGRCQLADPVERFLPAWKDMRVLRYGSHPSFATEPALRPMTIRDLLTHTAGLTYGFAQHDAIDAAYRKLELSAGIPGECSPTNLADMAQKLSQLPLMFSPGTRWNYSMATDVIGHLIEVVSGQTLDVFLRERIFAPLGMKDTGFSVPEHAHDRFAANYRYESGGAGHKSKLALQDDPAASKYLKPPSFLSGGGGLVGTIGDYARFCQMLLNQGQLDGARIIGRKTLELMTQNHLPGGVDLSQISSGSFSETSHDGVGFGLGFAVVLDVARRQWHGSRGEFYWGGAASTAFWVDPSEDLFVVFMTQLMPSTVYAFRSQLRSLVYAAIDD